jgi:hypothetical protein
MKFLAAAQQYLTVLIAMQWAYMVCVFGYAKWGFLGAAAGLVASPALCRSPRLRHGCTAKLRPSTPFTVCFSPGAQASA